MKLKGILSLALVAIICGCSCGRVNETTYNNAVSNFNSSDAISFVRISDEVDNNDSSSYKRNKINASFIFDTNRSGEVMEFYYKVEDSVMRDVNSTVEYYYSSIANTLYRKKVVTGVSEENIKEPLNYNSYFNVHNCSTVACRVAILTNIAPIFEIEDINEFIIEKVDDEAVVTYSAACPVFENCQGHEKLDYTLIIGGDGNAKNLSYEIVGETTTTKVSYAFEKFGIKNVDIIFPTELENYKDGKIN